MAAAAARAGRRQRRALSSYSNDLLRRATVLGLLLALLLGGLTSAEEPAQPQLRSTGLVWQGDGSLAPASPALTGRYVDGSHVLAPADDGALGAAAARAVEESRRWLAEGSTPGAGTTFADLGTRALLDVRALTLPNGAMRAAPRPSWNYLWPRDAAFAVAAYAVTGHADDAFATLRHLASIAPSDGQWQARYLLDGSGRVPDARGVQRDGAGWVLWATWVWYAEATRAGGEAAATAQDRLAQLWPMLAASADGISASLDDRGLPPASPDYWELPVDSVTLGIAAPSLAGLRAAADLARYAGRPPQERAWRTAAERLAGGVEQHFTDRGFPRSVTGDGRDAAVTFLAPPFVARDDAVMTAVASTRAALTLGNGGVRPGTAWRSRGVAWTPQLGMFALAFAAGGDRPRALEALRWLDRHRTSLGAISEKVDRDGRPAGVAPLGWTNALVVLALESLERSLPVPPG
jgi:glucoamylase